MPDHAPRNCCDSLVSQGLHVAKCPMVRDHGRMLRFPGVLGRATTSGLQPSLGAHKWATTFTIPCTSASPWKTKKSWSRGPAGLQEPRASNLFQPEKLLKCNPLQPSCALYRCQSWEGVSERKVCSPSCLRRMLTFRPPSPPPSPLRQPPRKQSSNTVLDVAVKLTYEM